MTLEKAKELLQIQIAMGSGYNRHAARLILAEVQHEHGQVAVDRLIRDLDLEAKYDLKPGMVFKTPGRN